MPQNVTIREYGVLHRGGDYSGLDAASLPINEWEWLLHKGTQLSSDARALFKPIIRGGQEVLQVLNYVGFLELPTGIVIEILPKVTEHETQDSARYHLVKMLSRVNDLPYTRFEDASLKAYKRPLLEVLIGRFLATAQHLINRGLRSEYLRVANDEYYLRGKLRVSAHLRQPPHRRALFPVEYDEYRLERPENKLLHWAIDQVYHWSSESLHRVHARKLLTLLSSIPKSEEPEVDLACWRSDRLMQHYQPIKPWIDLIVSNRSPWIQSGQYRGISMLFPMEQLFERYVEKVLRTQLSDGIDLVAQPRAGWLAEHSGKDWFMLQPDMTVRKEKVNKAILDTKWKRIDMYKGDRRNKYGISQSDIYQLFAYGQRCLPDGGALFLVYPKNENFTAPLPVFSFDEKLKLWVTPFDLETDKLLTSQWVTSTGWLSN